MKDIAELRRDIDEIDDKIAELFLDRMEKMDAVASSIFSPSRFISLIPLS